MATEIIMPKLGVDMSEGQIVEWKKAVGDQVEEGDVLVEIMSDKTNMELEAEESGTLLKIVHQNGDTVPVTEAIAYIGEAGEIVEDTDSTSGSDSLTNSKEASTTILNAESAAQHAEKATDSSTKKMDKIPSDEHGSYDYDLIVIGGGPAGYYAAIRASQLGAKVAVIEKNTVGGTCLNRGCIPTKTYLKNAEIIDGIKEAQTRGIELESTNFKVDMEKTLKLKRSVVSQLTNGVKGLLKSNGIDLFDGVGSVSADKVVHVGDKSFTSRKIILATGSKASRIRIEGIESKLVMTSDEILEMDIVPKTLAVIGGGVIGVEMSEAFRAFGSKIIIIEMSERLVPAADEEVSQVLRNSLEKKGVKVLTSSSLKRIEEKDGHLVLHIDGKEDVVCERALLSIGRAPDLEGLEDLQLETDRGRIKVNDYMETNIEGIYAPGDVNGSKMLAHAAFRMGEIAAENAIQGNHRKVELFTTPAALYTVPEIGMAGLTEAEARKRYDIRVGKFNFAGNGRALASGEPLGFVKVIADAKFGEILGVHIIGPTAAEIINEAAALMRMEITVNEVLKTIHGHPTFSEAFYEACADVLGEAIHLPKKRNAR